MIVYSSFDIGAVLFFAVSFIVSLTAFYFGRRPAVDAGFVDKPDARKSHSDHIPPIGGLVIIPLFILLGGLQSEGELVSWVLFVGLFVLMILGMIDDAVYIRPLVKLFVQVAVCIFVVYAGDLRIESLGNVLGTGELELYFWGDLFAVICLVLLVNALNMIDGVDGLAGGICTVILFWLMLACAVAGEWYSFQTLGMLLAPLLGFLVFNMRHFFRKKASVFLGDSGSLAMGLAIGWFVIRLSQTDIAGGDGGGVVVAPVSVAWILAVPIMDSFALFFVRIKKGRHPFAADRNHLHHTLLDKGLSHSAVTGIIVFIAFLMGAIGYIGKIFFEIPDIVLISLWSVLLLLHAAVVLYRDSGDSSA